MTVSATPPDTVIGRNVPELWKTRKDKVRFQWSSVLLLSPAIGLLVILFLIPVAYAFYLGFTNLTLLGPTAVRWGWTGTQNLTRLASDTTFESSLWITLFFVVGSIIGVVAMGYWLSSLLLRTQPWVRVLVGGIVVIAWMMPTISAGMTWYASSTAGGAFGALIGHPQADLLANQPLLIVTLANIWSQTGFAMLVTGAALRNIPSEILEAASVENASSWQRFRMIVLPLLRPTLIAVVLIVALFSLGNFALIYVMTQGGPGNATDILPLYSYQQAFDFNNLAYGALIGNVMVIIASIFGVLYVRMASRGSS